MAGERNGVRGGSATASGGSEGARRAPQLYRGGATQCAQNELDTADIVRD